MVGLGVAATAVQDLLLPLVFLHAWQVILLERPLGAPQLLGLGLVVGVLRFALLAQTTVDLVGGLPDPLGVYGPGLLGASASSSSFSSSIAARWACTLARSFSV